MKNLIVVILFSISFSIISYALFNDWTKAVSLGIILAIFFNTFSQILCELKR